MKPRSLPTRRNTQPRTLLARVMHQLKAPSSKPRRHRAAAAAAAIDSHELPEENQRRSARALFMIFAIHILAIIGFFIHKQFIASHTTAQPAAAGTNSRAQDSSPSARNNARPALANGDRTYLVRAGDNYAIIARNHGVDEAELRNYNQGADIRPGLVLRIPEGRRIVAEDPPAVAILRNPPPRAVPVEEEEGLIDVLPPVVDEPVVSDSNLIAAPRALVVRPQATQQSTSQVVASGRSHRVKAGDNLWRIARQYGVSQDELMQLNKISDPTKLRIGQVLEIPR